MDVVNVSVHARRELGPLARVWRSIGYDEINYTYTPNGRRVLRAIQELGDGPFWIRNHFAFSSGNLLSSPARGSTNCYTEDAARQARYDWSTVDRIYDSFLEHGCKPFIELGFMPHALSSHPEVGMLLSERYPPKDYTRWRELNRQFALHLIGRYGADEVRSWHFAPWNEPDLSYYFQWKPDEDLSQVEQRTLRDEEFFKLFDYAADGLRSADERLVLGGPELAGDVGFLERFLEHCHNGKNHATGRSGTRLDFLSFHCKGTGIRDGAVANPDFDELGRRRLGKYFAVLSRFPRFANLPLMLNEWDIDVGTFRGLHESADFRFRNTSYYPTFVARTMKELSDRILRDGMNIALVTQWAFTFLGMRCFEGTRSLFDPMGVRKPVFNAFELLARLGDVRVSAESDDREQDIAPGEVVGMKRSRRPRDEEDERSIPEWDRVQPHRSVDALATAKEDEVAVLAWYQVCDQYARGERAVRVRVDELEGWEAASIRHYRIDARHSNANTVWESLGSPDWPTEAQISAMREREGLETLGPDMRVSVQHGAVELELSLPVHAVSLLLLSRVA